MTDDLLTTFRAEMPEPDDATAQQIYRRATSGRRRFMTKRTLVPVVAVLAAAGIAGGLTATLGGSKPPAANGPSGPGLGGFMRLNPLTADFTASGNEYTAIDLTIRAVTPATTLHITVVRSDATQVSEADGAANHTVFDEQVSPTVLDSAGQDATQSTWSGTLTPTDWNGGCQQALYRIEYEFGSDGGSGSSGWFQCSGPAVDPSNPFLTQIPAGATGATGPTGGTGPTGPSGTG